MTHENTQPTDEALEQRLDAVLGEINSIKSQLELAKINVKFGEKPPDPDWIRRARYSLRNKGREHQRILHKLSKRKKARNQRREARMENAFFNVVKREVGEELFQKMVAEATKTAQQN